MLPLHLTLSKRRVFSALAPANAPNEGIVSPIATGEHLEHEEAVVHGERTLQQAAPRFEEGGRQRLKPAHQPPSRSLTEPSVARPHRARGIALARTEGDHERAERFGIGWPDAEQSRRCLVGLGTDEPARKASQMRRLGGPEHLGK